MRGARLLKAKEWLSKYPYVPSLTAAFVDASDAEEQDAQAERLGQERLRGRGSGLRVDDDRLSARRIVRCTGRYRRSGPERRANWQP